jgi:hypothetical protein
MSEEMFLMRLRLVLAAGHTSAYDLRADISELLNERRAEIESLRGAPVVPQSPKTACALCGRDPAAGVARDYRDGVERRLCHGDDDPAPTCYSRWLYGERPVLVPQDEPPRVGNSTTEPGAFISADFISRQAVEQWAIADFNEELLGFLKTFKSVPVLDTPPDKDAE